MTPQITLQLHTLREPLAADYEGTIRAVAAMGFPNIEPAGFPGITVSAAAKLFKELELKAPSTHCSLPIGDDKNEIIETALELGHRYLITGGPPNWQDSYGTTDQIKAAAELYCQAAENAAPHGLQVGYHNHDWDIAVIDERPAYHIFLAHTPETVLWEADIFWVARAGIDPAGFIQEIGPRGKVLHFKDGHINNREIVPPYLPAGEGDVDFKAAYGAARHAEYIAVELDAYADDMLEAVQKSYTYLTKNNMATGKR
ncbi:sugar phosphate isomerase/epimerase family protein [Coraliomargarita sp. W4R72]